MLYWDKLKKELKGKSVVGKGAETTGMTVALRGFSLKASQGVSWGWCPCTKTHHAQTSSEKRARTVTFLLLNHSCSPKSTQFLPKVLERCVLPFANKICGDADFLFQDFASVDSITTSTTISFFDVNYKINKYKHAYKYIHMNTNEWMNK